MYVLATTEQYIFPLGNVTVSSSSLVAVLVLVLVCHYAIIDSAKTS